jgi:ribosome maturation protein Sdo1
MIAVQFPPRCAPRAQSEARRFADPIREEWQPDGTWTGLFDVTEDDAAEFRALVEEACDGHARVKEIESEDEIGGHRMALYLF